MQHYLGRLARYNSWMNEKLYVVCDTIPDPIRKEDRKAFFKSIHGILNHLLLADRVWMGRFTGQPFDARSLDQELYEDFPILWVERRKTDSAIEQWVGRLTPDHLESPLRFTSLAGLGKHEFPLWQVVQHFFNHQTHHRGQLTTLINQMGYDTGVTDLLVMPGPEG